MRTPPIRLDLRLLGSVVAFVALLLSLLSAHPSPGASYPIVVAARPILPGAKLTIRDLSISDDPLYLPGALTNPRQAVGRQLRVALVPGEPLFRQELAAGSRHFVLMTIPASAASTTSGSAEVLLLPARGAPRLLLARAPIWASSTGVSGATLFTLLVPSDLAPLLASIRPPASVLALPESP